MSIFLLMLTILLTKEIFGDGYTNDGYTYCANLEIFQSSLNIPRNCGIIEGDVTIRDITNTSLLPLDNLKSIKVIIGKLEIARTSIRSLHFLSGVRNVRGSINIHQNTELLYVEPFFEILSLGPTLFNFEQLQLSNNPKVCLAVHFIFFENLKKNLNKIKDEKTIKEVTETGCQHHCSQQRGVQEGCKYLHGDLILENIDELRRNELRKYMDIEVILEGRLILRNNTGIKQLEFLSELREIYPDWRPNKTIAIEISDNVDMKMNFHRISITSFESEERVIILDDEAQFKLIWENLNENTTTKTTKTTATTTERSTVEIVTTTLQEETTTPVILVALKLPHLALAGVLGVIGLLLVLSAVLFWNYIIRIKRKIRREMKSRSLFYEQTPTFSHRLEPNLSSKPSWE